ncbi:MAG TPA: glycosyltransferase family 4 protein [Actinomycetota bacterium]|nr:glycosyltransferase family 4 protein [Actinomycetota bacterium]
MKTRRIVHILPRFSQDRPGGAEIAVASLAPHLEELGMRSEIWTTRRAGEATSERFGDLLVRRFSGLFLSKKERGLAERGKVPISLSLAWNLAIRSRPDVLHLHLHNRLSSLAATVAKARRIPTVITLHSRFRLIRPRPIYWFPNEAAVRLADAVIGVAPLITEMVVSAGIRPRRGATIPNGVDIDLFRGDGAAFRRELDINSGPVVLCVGRIYDVKNQLGLIDSFEQLMLDVPDAHLVLLGFPADREYFEKVVRAISRPGLEGRCHLLTDVTQQDHRFFDAYAAADVVAIPSRFEALSLVALEAWAAGAPLVANRVGGLATLITPGVDGLLVDETDDPSAMTNALRRVLTDPQLADDLRTNASKTAIRYSWREIARDLSVVYESVSR